MGFRDTSTSWGWPTKLLHWGMAVLIIGLLALGTYMTKLEVGLERFELTQIHKSFGFVVFVLACLRLVWRWIAPAGPSSPDSPHAWERIVSRVTRVGMYVLMFALPLTGWLMASASPFNDPDSYIYIPNMVFGLFEMPDPIAKGDAVLTKQLKVIHQYIGYALAALLVLHVAAAIKHHFILRDYVLVRMLPFGQDR